MEAFRDCTRSVEAYSCCSISGGKIVILFRRRTSLSSTWRGVNWHQKGYKNIENNDFTVVGNSPAFRSFCFSSLLFFFLKTFFFVVFFYFIFTFCLLLFGFYLVIGAHFYCVFYWWGLQQEVKTDFSALDWSSVKLFLFERAPSHRLEKWAKTRLAETTLFQVK